MGGPQPEQLLWLEILADTFSSSFVVEEGGIQATLTLTAHPVHLGVQRLPNPVLAVFQPNLESPVEKHGQRKKRSIRWGMEGRSPAQTPRVRAEPLRPPRSPHKEPSVRR